MGRFRALHALNRRDDSVDDRRSAGRILTDPVRCNAGSVLDLSCTGARMLPFSRWKVGDVRPVSFSFSSGDGAVTVKARCAWVRKRGLFGLGQIVGLQFVDVTMPERTALTRIATSSAKRAWASHASTDVDWERLERQAQKRGASKDVGCDVSKDAA